jgi:entry exclusion lipoprotein TrbK
MKNLLPVLALLLLAGCTSEPTPPTELERCIKANYADLTNKEDQEEFIVSKLKSEIESLIQDLKDDPEQKRLSDQDLNRWHQWETKDKENKENEEVFDDFAFEENEEILEEQEEYSSTKEYVDYMEKWDNKLIDLEEKHKGEYRLTVAEEYYGPEESKKREKVAEKICNTQGIY